MLDIFLGLIDTMRIQADPMRASHGKSLFVPLMLLLIPCLGHTTLDAPYLDEESMENQFSAESNSSAIFTSSGGSGLAVSGEPAYVGDTLIASLMVTNSGDLTGLASLQISQLNAEGIFQGDNVEISPGSTREVSVPFSQMSSGSNSFHWWLAEEGQTDNFSLEGNLTVEVSPSQILNLSMDYIDWTTTGGLNIETSVFLSPGRSRGIILEASSGTLGSYHLLQRIVMEADPGRRNIELDLGHPSADEIRIEAIPIGWQPSAESNNISQNSVEEPIVDETSISIEAQFNPESPTPGSKPLVTVILTNGGENQANPGIVRVLRSSDRTILAETEIQTVTPGSVVTTDISLPNWPESERVDLEVQWSTGGARVSIYPSVETDSGDEGLELPFDLVAVGYGTLAGVLIVLVGTLVWRAVSTRTPSTSDFRLRETKESSESESRQEKKEIHCIFCEQRLMVPSDHSGGVRCPACSMEFVVGEAEMPSPAVVRSSEDTLNCPECEQALRVKMEKRPVMSRCPVCKTHFMAEAEGV